MAFTVQVLEDGPRNYVIKVVGTSADAAPGALLVDVSTLSKDSTYKRDCTRVRLNELKYDLAPGNTVQLLWDATVDTVAWSMSEGPGQSVCFNDAGGINNPMDAGATGDVLLISAGTTVSYSFVAYFVKKYF